MLQQIEQALGLGATRRLASLYAGINQKTFERWLHRYAAFVEIVGRAEGRAAVGWLTKIERAAESGEWRAAAWKLEHRYPREYGRQVFEHTGDDDRPVKIEVVPIDYRTAIRTLAPPDAEEGPVGD